MARYIDAELVPALFNEEFKETRKLISQGETHLDNLAEGFTEADRVIRKMPTADVVEVVRCKDCIHYCIESADGGKYCEILRYESPIESGYCCYGQRKHQREVE